MTQASWWQHYCTGAVISSGDGQQISPGCAQKSDSHISCVSSNAVVRDTLFIYLFEVTARLRVVNCIYFLSCFSPSNVCNCAQNIQSPRVLLPCSTRVPRPFSVHPIAICESPSKRCPLAEDGNREAVYDQQVAGIISIARLK